MSLVPNTLSLCDIYIYEVSWLYLIWFRSYGLDMNFDQGQISQKQEVSINSAFRYSPQGNDCLVGTEKQWNKMHSCFRLHVTGKTNTDKTGIRIGINGEVKVAVILSVANFFMHMFNMSLSAIWCVMQTKEMQQRPKSAIWCVSWVPQPCIIRVSWALIIMYLKAKLGLDHNSEGWSRCLDHES